MLSIAHGLRNVLYPFLALMTAVLVVLLAAILLRRLAGLVVEARSGRLEQRYHDSIAALVAPGAGAAAQAAFAAVPERDLDGVGRLLLAPLAVTTGETVDAVRGAAIRAGLDRRWRNGLRSGRWWTRAESARALGLIRHPEATAPLLEMLGDEHEEARAAAIDALGSIADPAALPFLVPLLADPSRHQRARVADALRRHGEAAVAPLLARAAAAPRDRLTISEVLGLIRGQGATLTLLGWTGDDSPALRAAAWRSLGGLGLDDRTYYHALKALRDPSVEVRAAAARALGQARHEASAPYLAALLDDEWLAAAQAAAALQRMGAAGRVALERRAGGTDGAADLARQMIWERDAFGGERR